MDTTIDGGWFGLALLVSFIAVGFLAIRHGRSKSPATQVSSSSQNGQPGPNPAPTPTTVQAAPKAAKTAGGSNWFGTAIKGVILAAVAVIGSFYVYTHVIEPVIHAPVPVVSQRIRQGVVAVETKEQAGSIPVCPPNSAIVHEVGEVGWKSRDVPAGCTPVFDPGYSTGLFLVEFKDRTTGVWLPTNTDYTAYRLQKQVTPEHGTIKVQTWFIQFKPQPE